MQNKYLIALETVYFKTQHNRFKLYLKMYNRRKVLVSEVSFHQQSADSSQISASLHSTQQLHLHDRTYGFMLLTAHISLLILYGQESEKTQLKKQGNYTIKQPGCHHIHNRIEDNCVRLHNERCIPITWKTLHINTHIWQHKMNWHMTYHKYSVLTFIIKTTF
jgi:hypothetical protein